MTKAIRHRQTIKPSKDSTDDRPIYGFMHFYATNNWRRILKEQLNAITKSGLHENSAQIQLTIVNPGRKQLPIRHLARLERLNIKIVDSISGPAWITELGEGATLIDLRNRCIQQDCIVWYAHGKGVSKYFHQWYPDIANWRYLCEHYTLSDYHACLSSIRCGHYDISGPLWNGNCSWPHFSGNFWWASSEYIKHLPPIRDYAVVYEDRFNAPKRFAAEAWLGSAIRDGRAKSVFDFAPAYSHPYLYEIDITEQLHQIGIKAYRERLWSLYNLGRRVRTMLNPVTPTTPRIKSTIITHY